MQKIYRKLRDKKKGHLQMMESEVIQAVFEV